MAYALTKSWKTAVLDRTSLSNELTVPDNLQNSVDHIVDSAGRLSFETRTGFTVHGSALQYARVTGVSCDVFAEGGAQQVRVHADYEPVNPRNKFQKRAALLRFGDGTGIVLAVLPGYVGSVVLEDHRVVTVNYTPSRGTRNFTEYKYAGRDLERRRAFVAVAARNGSFRLDPEAAQGTAQYLRMLKQVDPTLGLYAAYAYAQAGDGKGVVSVYRYMEREPEPVIFDVGMLAARQIPQAQRTLDFAPWMPMLTQGWMLLGDFANAMPEPLRRARAHLLPGLWTTFAPEGMDVLEAEIFGGLKL